MHDKGKKKAILTPLFLAFFLSLRYDRTRLWNKGEKTHESVT